MSKKEAFYKNLKEQLNDTTKFPSDYLYKFIVPSDENQVKDVKNIFNKSGGVINTKISKTGKYVSISILLTVNNSDQVISYYKKVENIKGIISL